MRLRCLRALCSWCCGIFLLAVALPALAAPIAAYTPLFKAVTTTDGDVRCLIRTFVRGGVPQGVLVDPWTLETSIAAVAGLQEAAPAVLEGTPYLRTLHRTTAGPVRLQNHGLTRANRIANGQVVTVDLCPSKRPFEQGLFQAMADLEQPKPVPVAVAITGSWLTAHEQEFSWLREQERLGRLAITWVNHSLSHPYDATAPLAKTFLLTPGLDRRQEILALERLLLERDVLPAPFFRFPGLVADEAAIQLVRELGLIPLGSDAWLAKGELPRDGSIILVHGNGNEPAGIRRFHQLRQQAGLLRQLPLRAIVAENQKILMPGQ
jgi:hypothetical protein